MTNETKQNDAQEERSQLDVLESLDIASLRKYAKLMNIAAQRDWTAEDYVQAIKVKQEQNKIASIVFDNTNAPAPGHARVLVHRDMTPGHKNGPVQVGVNGRLVHIPRGIEVDIPIPYVEALKNSKSLQIRQVESGGQGSPMGTYRDEEISYYPFQIISITPGGNFQNPHDSRGASYERRFAFHKAFGRWPTDGELKEAMRAKIIKEM